LRASDPVTRLKGVGPALAGKLAGLAIERIVDLLLHLPTRYEDRTRVVALADLQRDDECLTVGRLMGSRIAFGKRRSWLVTLEDAGRRLTLRFFHFSATQQKSLVAGSWVRCFGQVRIGPHGLEMVHPEYRVFAERPDPPEPRLVPVYPSTEGVTQPRLRTLTLAALPALATLPVAPIGANAPEQGAFPSLVDALRFVHDPPAGATSTSLESAAERIAFDEMVAHALVMRERRITRAREQTLPLPRDAQLGRMLIENLGFELTSAQRRVVREVLLDLERPVPMLRLVQGDVGSGKTVVAAFAAIRAAEHRCQTAIMAPTEILAEQHYLNFVEWLQPPCIRGRLVDGRLSAAEA